MKQIDKQEFGISGCLFATKLRHAPLPPTRSGTSMGMKDVFLARLGGCCPVVAALGVRGFPRPVGVENMGTESKAV